MLPRGYDAAHDPPIPLVLSPHGRGAGALSNARTPRSSIRSCLSRSGGSASYRRETIETRSGVSYDAQMLQEPGRREPAPQPLRLVQAFVNTRDFENGVEELTSPEALRDALARIGVLNGDDARFGDSDLRHALEVREALRELLLANNGGSVGPAALATLERAARSGHLGISFSPTHAELVAEEAA